MHSDETQSIRSLADALAKGLLSSEELTRHYIERIQQQAHLNAFIHVDEQHALQNARLADKRIREKRQHILTGIPMAHKDNVCTRNSITSAGSKMLEQYRSPFDATIVEKLNACSVVNLGKTNMDEFAMGSANRHSYFGVVKNPWDTSRVPGGSSGGSAAAVAAELCLWATGSDTGGSIRQPAAFCGISGLKPTYGRVSRYGMVAYASSLDQAGPMARSAEDCAHILNAMAGFDPKDSTSDTRTSPDFSQQLQASIKGLKIGIPDCFLSEAVQPDITEHIKSALRVLEQEGALIIPVDIQHQALWVPCYYVIACAEASSNLSRFDGIRFGHRSRQTTDLAELITQSREEGFGAEVKRRILTGTHILSAGYYDAYYLQALKVRRMIRDEFVRLFTQVDLIIGPTSPTIAFSLAEEEKNPVHAYLADVFTVGANLAGLPALSLPAGFSQGLPIGMQLIGKAFAESTLLQVGHRYQQRTDWHLRRPDMTKE
ncbi:MAG: Asp-tRNA(Asn)/Glu-tRNA(Gln) amidotransferase subunit GatA [Legionellaceae bacterium]|nr:Asp-tRNA(Asn)/Glu-tRNA(Gln) amidotransferase subunit GatA [Legionellaceae bacterium]